MMDRPLPHWLLAPDQNLILFTDGCALTNPGVGGWAFLLVAEGCPGEFARFGGLTHTTSVAAELIAAVRGLSILPADTAVQLRTDSEILHRGLTEWLGRWRRNGWYNAAGKPVRNQHLWRRLDRLSRHREIDSVWVPGHSGVDGNERCDQLARQAADQKQRELLARSTWQ